MKKLLVLLIVGALLVSASGVFSISNDKINIKTLAVSFSQPYITIEEDFAVVNIAEANTHLMETGKPLLPGYNEVFTFPFKTKIISVKCTPCNIQSLAITKDIKPAPKPVIVGETISTDQKVSVNYGVEPYPLNWFEYNVGCGLYNGELSVIVKVAFNPVKYYPAEKIIEWAENANIVIQYENPVEQTTVPEQYQLLIIAPDEYSDELAPLINHKISRGITTKFAGLNEVYTGIGTDNQEDIKYFIWDAIEDWGTTNVLLVGSDSKLPARVTHVRIGNDDAEYFVSDLYYADIYDSNGDFCSWDSNGNGDFGEYNWSIFHYYDDVDLYPDIKLGRLACRTGTEVTTVVNKIINFENDEAYLQNWFKNLVVLGGDTFPHDNESEDVDEGEYLNQIVIDLMDDFNPIKLWASNGKLTEPLKGVQNIIDTINAGCGFVDFSGHGNTNIWATHAHLNFNNWIPTPTGGILTAQVLTLANDDKLPIITVEACDTARFNIDPNCFNWAFMYDSNGGAIGAFGATGLGWGYTGMYADWGIIGEIGLDTFRAFKLDDSMTLGEMWVNTLFRYINNQSEIEDYDYKTIEEWQIFGDPTLQIVKESGAPLKPARPSGSTSGIPDTEYSYTTSTTDPEDDDIYYMFDWGDGTNSDWIGPITSGEPVSAKHSWTTKNTYLVIVQANDTHGKLSEWSEPLSVTIPRNKITYYSFMFELIYNFNNLLPILHKILQRLG